MHNARFDFSFLEKYVTLTDLCTRKGQFYQAKTVIKDVELIFIDSYKLIPMPLKDFAKTFELECKK